MLRQLRRSTRIADRTTIDLYESNLDLEDKAQIDMLTGIYNRRYMEENLKRVVRSLARTGGFLSILMIDVDFFKKYNDTYGHAEGDVCLKAVAQALAGSLARPNDFAARYGGEEFSVILPDTDESGARLIAGKILENIRALGIPHEKNDAADCVTVSVGGAAGIVLQGDSGAEYVKRADEALYRSKQTGRNRYTFI
jgi:diguanylate cyclase (GGDEF)-like protein